MDDGASGRQARMLAQFARMADTDAKRAAGSTYTWRRFQQAPSANRYANVYSCTCGR